MLTQTSLLLALAASASAHMILDFPKPFGRATLNSSPLEPKDFPCKQRPGAYTIDLGMNQWNAGETKDISINGTAAHAGGSCQYSITTDPEPTKDSQWKVIHSVIGNCMASILDNYHDVEFDTPKGVALLQQPAFKHPVTMPKNIPDGRYTFAWSWLNKKGNREFYMNCAPIQVGGSSSAASAESAAEALSALPDMFVANLPALSDPPRPELGPTCDIKSSVDFVYPDPGQSVVRGNSVNITFDNTFTGPGCATQIKMGAGAGKIGSPSPGTPSTPSQGTPSKPSSTPSQPQVSEKPAAGPPVKGEPQPTKIPTNPNGGILAPGASSAPAAAPTPQPDPPAAKPTPPATKPVPSTTPQTPSDNNTTPVNGDCTPCTNDGAVVCIGTKQFGLCNRGCVVAQDLAAGMACQGGVVVGSIKRHAFPRAHLHRRFSASHLI